ncbi:MAG: hypothetical protein PHI97_19400 [Desulfobulbus sp.]|nr:hypothetical protein [Desulfobulbus sp.]
MNRVGILLFGLLALFFSVTDGQATGFCKDCTVNGITSKCIYTYVVWGDATSRTLTTTDSLVMDSYEKSGGWDDKYDTGTSYYLQPLYRTYTYWFDSQQKWVTSSLSYYNARTKSVKTSELSLSEAFPSMDADTCSEGACDNSDDDSDGVCNSCDTNPGTPDPKHCVYTQSVTASGQVVSMGIDQSGNCDGSQIQLYTNSSLLGQKTFWDIGSNSQEITAPSCQGDDGTGNCKCSYPTSNSIFTNFSEDTGTSMTPGLLDQIKNEKEKKDDPNYDDCSNIKSRCETACLSRGGVLTNSCTVSGDTTYVECKCQNEFAYDIVTPTEERADDSTNGDPTQTGGTDSNSDGKDDTYAAVKDAINDSTLSSKIDSTNNQLNTISNKIDTVGSAINGVGSAINGVGEAINGVGQGVNGLGTKLDSIGNKLDDLRQDGNQDITATGDASLPGSNFYNSTVDVVEEFKLGDSIGNFISSGIPIISYLKGTYIDVGSAQPSMSTEIMGKTITIDFSQVEGILNNMGLVLVALSTILAFMIIVHKG